MSLHDNAQSAAMELWVTERQTPGRKLSLKVSETLFHGVSDYQVVDIVDTEEYGRMLLLDGLVMTTERDEFVYHEMISHIPLLAHPEPKQVLVIGGGDGGTVREVLRHPSVERVVLCEIDGMVIDSCKEFLPSIAGKLDDPRCEVYVGDGVAYIENNPGMFDAILVDSTDPFGPAEGLIAESFYINVRKALTDNGVMAAQTESPFANAKEYRTIYERLFRVFSPVRSYVAPIPTYPGGYWSWAFCGKMGMQPEQADLTRLAAFEHELKFLNRDVFKAVFALPNFVKAMLPEVAPV